ncbi:MAG: M23 family metallopeptidase [Elusimicrobia bacterium]|nr:M23 family metallopeptidase [Elusimicrobiota bacterium]
MPKTGRKKFYVPKKRLTIMFLPHSGSGGIQINLSYFGIFFIFFVWFAGVSLSVYLLSNRVENASVVSANKKLKQEVVSFSRKFANSLDLVKDTQDLNTRLRGLLALGKKSKVIEYSAAGGPSKLQEIRLSKILFGTSPFDAEKVADLNLEELYASGWQAKVNFKEISQYLKEQRLIARATPAIWPLFGRLTSGFAWRTHPITGKPEFHRGLDIANLKGTPIRATADGRVVFAGWAGNLGKAVVLSHRMGYTTFYGHCDQVFVKQGQKIKRGQIIASVGMTGMTTGPHVHYEVRRWGKPLNPMYFVNRSF